MITNYLGKRHLSINIRVSIIKKCVSKRVSGKNWEDLQKNHKAKFYPYVLFKSEFSKLFTI